MPNKCILCVKVKFFGHLPSCDKMGEPQYIIYLLLLLLLFMLEEFKAALHLTLEAYVIRSSVDHRFKHQVIRFEVKRGPRGGTSPRVKLRANSIPSSRLRAGVTEASISTPLDLLAHDRLRAGIATPASFRLAVGEFLPHSFHTAQDPSER